MTRRLSFLAGNGKAMVIAAALFFLALELLLRIKLGSIICLAAMFFLFQRVASREASGRGPWLPDDRDFLDAARSAVIAGGLIFLVFALANALARTFDPAFRFFQLP